MTDQPASSQHDQFRAELADAWRKFAAVAAQRDRLRIRMNALADRWDLEGPPPGNRPLTELRAEISIEPLPPTPAEAAIARVRAECDRLHRASVLADDEPHTDRERGIVQAITRIRAALAEPAPTTPATSLRWTVATQVDTHTCTEDRDATSVWLAGHPHHWADGQLVIDTVDGPVPAPHGYLLVRWPDGDVIVMSPRSAAKRLHGAGPATTQATDQPKEN
jgi:hypothetical protein